MSQELVSLNNRCTGEYSDVVWHEYKNYYCGGNNKSCPLNVFKGHCAARKCAFRVKSLPDTLRSSYLAECRFCCKDLKECLLNKEGQCFAKKCPFLAKMKRSEGDCGG